MDTAAIHQNKNSTDTIILLRMLSRVLRNASTVVTDDNLSRQMTKNPKQDDSIFQGMHPESFGLIELSIAGSASPGWLSGERVGLMTWWLQVRSPVEATFLSSVFSPLTSAEVCGKSSRWLWKEKLC